ncbi:MAG TPA: hypothetical protein VEF89_03880 [Solirubrobacteraceae bacterium]|nr:hypothetical protein [Solirubrobacteraceae bacterium]
MTGVDVRGHATRPTPGSLLDGRTGVAGAIGLLLDRPAIAGTAISLSAVPSGAQILIHSVLAASAKSGARSFTPTLQSVLPSGSTLMLDVDGLDRMAPELLHAAGDATVHEVQLGPGLQVDFGVWGGLAVVSTSIQAIDEVAPRSRALADDAAYKAVIPDGSGPVSSLLFGDFTRLLSLAEQTGLTSGTRPASCCPTSRRSARSV